MASEITGEELINQAKQGGSFQDMSEFNNDVRNAVKGKETSHVLGGNEQRRVNDINKQVNRINNYMKNIGYVIPSNERQEYMVVIEALKNGEIDKIPQDLLEKIEGREALLNENDERD